MNAWTLRDSRESIYVDYSIESTFPTSSGILGRLSNVIQDPINRHYISSRRESGSLASTIIIFLWILDSKISNLLQNPQNIKKKRNRIRDFDSFVDEAAPGFELGKKDLQSPALPLGHAAKTIHNRIKISLFELD